MERYDPEFKVAYVGKLPLVFLVLPVAQKICRPQDSMHRIEAVGFLRLRVISRRGGSIGPQMTAIFVTRLQMW